MRRVLAVGLGTAALTLAATVVPAVLPADGPTAPLRVTPASAALAPSSDCSALLQWYVARGVDLVGPWGWGGPIVPMTAMADSARGASPSGEAVTNGPTGTNTQETGVDEPDTAKTDGRLVVRVVDQRRVVVTDVSGSRPRELGSWRAPESSWVQDLLLVGDHVLVTSSAPRVLTGRLGPATDLAMLPRGTTLTDLDLSDPSAPLVASRTTRSGDRLSLRAHDGVVRLVTSTGLPDLPFVHPQPGRLSRSAALERNREVVRSSRISDWLPGVESGGDSDDDSGGTSRSSVSCGDVLHPTTEDTGTETGLATVEISTFRPGAVPEARSVAVTAAGDDVYSSTDRLYVTSTDWGARRTSTQVHAFALDGAETRYVASGTVDGSIRDHWSLDEHDGDLRVAVAWQGRGGRTLDNGVVVLRESGDRLVQVGQLRGLGRGEEIQSVRWFDDLAVLVTFRQVDPLYTVDLAEPAAPRLLGALKIPGFSAYLHPLGGDRLLGLGSDATAQGQDLGAQAAVFDLRDLADVRRLGTVTFPGDTRLGVADDPHAFTWLPGADAAITSLDDWSRSDQTRVVLLRVGADGSLRTSDLPSPGGYAVRALPLPGGRVALVGDRVLVTRVG